MKRSIISKEVLLFSLAAMLNLAAWLKLILGVPSSTFPVIVYYNVFWHQDIIAERTMIFSSPLLGTIILIINMLLVSALHDEKFRFFRWVLVGGTVVVQIFILAIAWILVAVNT